MGCALLETDLKCRFLASRRERSEDRAKLTSTTPEEKFLMAIAGLARGAEVPNVIHTKLDASEEISEKVSLKNWETCNIATTCDAICSGVASMAELPCLKCKYLACRRMRAENRVRLQAVRELQNMLMSTECVRGALPACATQELDPQHRGETCSLGPRAPCLAPKSEEQTVACQRRASESRGAAAGATLSPRAAKRHRLCTTVNGSKVGARGASLRAPSSTPPCPGSWIGTPPRGSAPGSLPVFAQVVPRVLAPRSSPLSTPAGGASAASPLLPRSSPLSTPSGGAGAASPPPRVFPPRSPLGTPTRGGGSIATPSRSRVLSSDSEKPDSMDVVPEIPEIEQSNVKGSMNRTLKKIQEIAVAREARRALAETIRQGAMPALEESNSETETDSTCEALDLSTDGDWSGTRNQNAVYPLMACCRRSPGRVSRRVACPRN